jgi:NADH-quinone oxidoreductase subunit M
MNPDVTKHFVIPVVALGLMNFVYGALVALKQDDLKKMIAYSSISHMGFVVFRNTKL